MSTLTKNTWNHFWKNLIFWTRRFRKFFNRKNVCAFQILHWWETNNDFSIKFIPLPSAPGHAALWRIFSERTCEKINIDFYESWISSRFSFFKIISKGKSEKKKKFFISFLQESRRRRRRLLSEHLSPNRPFQSPSTPRNQNRNGRPVREPAHTSRDRECQIEGIQEEGTCPKIYSRTFVFQKFQLLNQRFEFFQSSFSHKK